MSNIVLYAIERECAMSIKSPVESVVLKIKKTLAQKHAKKLARNNHLLQRGRFDLVEEWEQRKAENPEKLKEISARLYPEKYPLQHP